ncbi:MAG: hypothetical protein WCL51_12610 [Bacteroidota bacterium]
MIHKLRLLTLLTIVLFLISCNKKKNEVIVATAFEYNLYKSDLKGIVPPNTSKNDSVLIIKNYLNNWVRQKIILHKADKNLTNNQKDFTEQIENYRNSLVVYNYESKLITQLLDTVVKKEQIEDYYKKNTDNFLLKNNIIKVNYIKLSSKSPYKAKIKQMLFSGSDKNQLYKQCSQNAANYYIDDDKWLLFDDLLKEIPIETYDQEAYLRNHRTIEISDSSFYYLINIKDFKIKESISPLSFEKENIRNIIINKRKLELINKMHDEVYQDALKNKDFKIY